MKVILSIILLVTIYSCGRDPKIPDSLPDEEIEDVRIVVPQNWPQPIYNFQNNPLTQDGFLLGRKLFYDERLSLDNSISCADCHQQFAGFAHSAHPLSHGISGLLGTRNAPGLFNLNWHPSFMWDGGINHIENQPVAPIENPVEMGETFSQVIAKLNADATYREMFKKAFNSDTVTGALTLKAFAQFMGMIYSYNSKYDLYTRGEVTLDAQEMSGLNIVRQKCIGCHTEPLFTDFSYRNNGVPIDPTNIDLGRYHITNDPADSLKFKVPTLRNLSFTGPYGHDGRFTSLLQVLNHYSTINSSSLTLDALVQGGIPLTSQEKSDVIAFLKTLDDYKFISDPKFSDPGN